MAIHFLIVYILITLFSIIIHELSHGYVAYCLGDETAKKNGRLTLNPIKHLDIFMSFVLPVFLIIIGAPVVGGAKPVPLNYKKIKWNDYGVAIVALIGPISNLLLSFIFFGLYSVMIKINNNDLSIIFLMGSKVNLALMLFNLLPIPPLDGSRILHAFLPIKAKVFMIKLEQTAGVFIVISIVLFANYLIYKYINSLSEIFLNLFNFIFNV